MQAQNPVREDVKLKEDMKQEMMVCALQCVVRIPSIEHSNTHSLITSTPTAVFFLMNGLMTQIHFITLIALVSTVTVLL